MNLISVQRNARKLRKMLSRVSRSPRPAAIHKLRVRIRRFESALAALENTPIAKPSKKLKGLRQLRKKAGKVRDLDVFASTLASLNIKDDKDCLVELLLHIGEKRRRRERKLVKFVDKNSSQLQENIDNAMQKIQKRTRGRMAKPDDETLGQVRRAHESAFLKAARVSKIGRRNLHEYRKMLKSLLDITLIDSNNGLTKLANPLEKAKDAIGEWHDWEELAKMGDKVLKHGRACILQRKLHECRQTKFREAMRVANKVRIEQLKPRRLVATIPV